MKKRVLFLAAVLMAQASTAFATVSQGQLPFSQAFFKIYQDLTGPVLMMVVVVGVGWGLAKWASGGGLAGFVDAGKWIIVLSIVGGGLLAGMSQLGLTGALV